MTKQFVITGGVLLLTIIPVLAQPVPRVETNFSYSYGLGG